jgi:hypothetical protein
MNNNALFRFKVAPVNAREIKYNLYAPINKMTNIAQQKHATEYIVYEDEEFIVKIRVLKERTTKNGEKRFVVTKLLQLHRDLLDIILFYGKPYKYNDLEGKIISLNEIMEHYSDKSRNTNWVKEKVEELKNAKITIENKKRKRKVDFSIVRITMTDEITQKFIIIFEKLYLDFFEKSISINYKELVDEIVNLRYAVTKAAVRYLFTFKEQQINIDKLLRRIGVVGKEKNLEKYRDYLIEEIKEKKEFFKNKFGIEILKNNKKSNYTIRYIKPAEVKHYHPKES